MKLNLGCGSKKMDGYTNVDKYDVFEPDVVQDLEKFPWAFEDNSVDEIIMHHVLEHLGQTTEEYMNILAELYRICKADATIEIFVPHPYHYNFIGDPTHVRAITPEQFALFDEEVNPVSPLRESSGLKFKLVNLFYKPDHHYKLKLDAGEITYQEVLDLGRKQLNVFDETRMIIKVIKE